jgi:uncharacterized protein YkwD
MMVKSRKCLAFILAVMLITSFIPRVASANQDVLANLPYEQPANHSKDYHDFAGKATVLVFGNLNYEYGLKDFISTMDYLITTNNMQNQLNLLYFEIKSGKNDLKSFLDKQIWKNVYGFIGGYDEMWDIIFAQNMGTSVYLPVIVYVSADGQVKEISTGSQEVSAIRTNLAKIITINTATAVQYKVLADAKGETSAARKAEIYKRLQAIDQKATVSYDQAPNITTPHVAGSMKQSYQQNALHTLNLVRYLSGLPEVTLNHEYVTYAQHGAVLMAASEYGHTPPKPSDMTNEFYDTGYNGTSKGNIYHGCYNLFNGIVHGWMADEDPSNIDRLGHRRWALNPHMGATGFGEVNRLGVMYAIDNSAPDIDYHAIAYPSGSAFPSELFDGSYPWNVSLNPAIFAQPDINKVTVTLTGGGKTYTFSKNTSSFEGDYFNVDTKGYGINNSIIFRPSGIKKYEGTYKVKIDGLTTVLGDPVSLSYETTFYDVSPDDLKAATPSSWAESAVQRALELGLLPDSLAGDYQKPITRAEFSQLGVRLYENLMGPIEPTVTFSDTNDINVRKMATLGIVAGTGNGKFSPNVNITREQAAKILDLLLVNLGRPSNPKAVTYADQNNISGWAVEYVNSVSNQNIMGSVGANKFDPKGPYTREQSIVTIMRIYDLVK